MTSVQRFIQIDLFGLSASISFSNGKKIHYFIEDSGKKYRCYVKRKKGKRAEWSEAELVKESEKQIFLVYSETTLGVALV